MENPKKNSSDGSDSDMELEELSPQNPPCKRKRTSSRNATTPTDNQNSRKKFRSSSSTLPLTPHPEKTPDKQPTSLTSGEDCWDTEERKKIVSELDTLNDGRSLERANEVMKTKNTNLMEDNRELKQKFKMYEKEVTNLQKRNTQLILHLNNAKRVNTKLKIECGNKESVVTKRFTKLQTRHDTILAKQRALMDELVRLKNAQGKTNHSEEELRSQLRLAQEKIVVLNSQIESFTEENSQSDDSEIDPKVKLQLLVSENIRLKEKVAEVSNQGKEITLLKSHLECVTKRTKQLLTEAKERESTIKTLERKLELKKEDNSSVPQLQLCPQKNSQNIEALSNQDSN